MNSPAAVSRRLLGEVHPGPSHGPSAPGMGDVLGPRSALRPGWGPSAAEGFLGAVLATPVLASPSVAHEFEATDGEAVYDLMESIK
ncbi:MAG: hypothetical protein ACRDQU_01610 [Pseudonocardiaceae bacterium]